MLDSNPKTPSIYGGLLHVTATQATRGLRVAFIEEVRFDEGPDGVVFFGHCVGGVGGFGFHSVDVRGCHDVKIMQTIPRYVKLCSCHLEYRGKKI